MKKREHSFFFVFITVLLVFSCIEIASYFAANKLQAKGFFYKPFISKGYGEYLLRRDNLLGWPFPRLFGKDEEYDLKGSRIVPAFPDELNFKSCISLYGDSFTWGAEVDNEHAWGNVLSKILNCRVDNYGVGGYGSDQAYLRFRQNTTDDSSVVFLNHLSENIVRNVNRYRDLLIPEGGLAFKPRFLLNKEGSLELISMPTLTVAQYKDVALSPEKYLKNEYFIPGGPSGINVASFPYTLSIIKTLRHFRMKAYLRDEPAYLEFYQRNHISQALETTAAMLKAFNNDAIERGKTPIVTIIPTGMDLLYFKKHQGWPYDSLIEELSLHGISVFNFGTGILKHSKNSDPCLLYKNCFGHFNELGSEILAKLAYELLMERELLNKMGLQSTL